MTIFDYKGLTRNLEIGNTPIWVLPNIWRLEWVRDAKPDTNVSNEKLLDAAKCQVYSFYRFWVIKGKPKWRGVKNTPRQIKIRPKIVWPFYQNNWEKMIKLAIKFSKNIIAYVQTTKPTKIKTFLLKRLHDQIKKN